VGISNFPSGTQIQQPSSFARWMKKMLRKVTDPFSIQDLGDRIVPLHDATR
jgi:hypothetical protein